MGRLGDAIGRALDAVGAASLRDVAVRHHDRCNRGLAETVHRHRLQVAPGAVLVAGRAPRPAPGPPAPPRPPAGRPPPRPAGAGEPAPRPLPPPLPVSP